jgi:hypothetical protein
VPDKLSILSRPEMREEELKKLGKVKATQSSRRFTEVPTFQKERRGTLVGKLFSKPSAIKIKEQISTPSMITNPEEEFRQMFSEDKATLPDELSSEEDVQHKKTSNCCACFRRKKKRSKAEHKEKVSVSETAAIAISEQTGGI